MLSASLVLIVASLCAVFALRVAVPSRANAITLAAVALVTSFFLYADHRQDVALGWTTTMEAFVTGENASVEWPPVVGQQYPDLKLFDHTGKQRTLSEFKGKVIVIEPVGTPCKGCIAFAGGHEYGPYDGVPPQEGLKSIHHYAKVYGSVDLDDPRIVFVQLLFYNDKMRAPSVEEGRKWAQHFKMTGSENRVVLVAEQCLLKQKTLGMIPGFQVIDKGFVLRYDSAGHKSPHDLYKELLPGIGGLVNE